MFVGFNAQIKDIFSHNYYETGLSMFQRQKAIINSTLSEFIQNDGYISATKLEESWFPSISADIFISHSHKDEKMAIGFAGWLFERFSITSFVDSCLWGYSNDLLSTVDQQYCVSSRDANGNIKTYDYQKRNQSTAHVHMLLNIALSKMIDKTECLVFINTPNSLLPQSEIQNTSTGSPWIYQELMFSTLVRKRKLKEYRKTIVHDGIYGLSSLNVCYDVTLDHLVSLTDLDLSAMESIPSKIESYAVLDQLYKRKGIIK